MNDNQDEVDQTAATHTTNNTMIVTDQDELNRTKTKEEVKVDGKKLDIAMKILKEKETEETAQSEDPYT